MRGFESGKTTSIFAKNISIEGRIQGVGFRPFLYRLAKKHSLTGWVKNCTEGVSLHVEGPRKNLDYFLKGITSEAPAAARVYRLQSYSSEVESYSSFSIQQSDSVIITDTIAEIAPDIAVCQDCLDDMHTQPSRMNYLFTNCTNCGPRFSIIKALPYDRPQTTMEPFTMCNTCLEEYSSVTDRRFHAQPNSCSECGPSYTFHSIDGKITDDRRIIQKTGEILKNGGICAIKGIGGFHLACNPFNTAAVNRLRELKKREGKPFAVMFSSIHEIKKHALVNLSEESALTSAEAPIVLLKIRPESSISPSVYRGLSTLGCFIPYTPFYHLLFKDSDMKAIVLTSGNFSNQPIINENSSALNAFLKETDGVITYNRKIHNRSDDSVGHVIVNTFHIIRRSRGWAPESLPVKDRVEGILAVGAELKSSFCIGKSKRAILSQHIGNLRNPETADFYLETIERFKDLFHFKPALIVHDLHPDYFSTRWAEASGISTLAVQHHHAHIASCLAENERDENVIGFSFDGTGLGNDGHLWGGEVFICNFSGYQRKYHLKYLPLPGGDAAVKEPWRIALSTLYQVYGRKLLNLPLPFLKELNPFKVEMAIQMIEKKVNTPLTSSMGRLFDAAAAMLGLCQISSFDAEGPMRLENAVDRKGQSYYQLTVENPEIDTAPIITGISEDIADGLKTGKIAAKFHNTIVNMTGSIAEILRGQTGISVCALSGGVFMNTCLLEGCEKLLKEKGFTVLTQSKVPSNDGGLALGQLAIGARKKQEDSHVYEYTGRNHFTEGK